MKSGGFASAILFLSLAACSTAPSAVPRRESAQTGASAAQHRILPHPKDYSFESFDESGDDIISQDEFRTRMTSRFAFLDRNRNGLIEVVPECGGWLWCATADTNGSGSISLAEFLEAALQEYYKYNQDGEDGLSRDEFSKLMEGMKFAGG